MNYLYVIIVAAIVFFLLESLYPTRLPIPQGYPNTAPIENSKQTKPLSEIWLEVPVEEFLQLESKTINQ